MKTRKIPSFPFSYLRSVTVFLAWRYLRSPHKEQTSSLMLKICCLGITIGTAALALTLIITNGYEKTIYEKLQGINANIMIQSSHDRFDINAMRKFLLEHYPTKIEAVAASSMREVLINERNVQRLCIIKGVEPEMEEKVTVLGSKILKPKANSFSSLFTIDRGVVIGKKLAEEYRLRIGDSLALLLPESAGKKKINLTKQKVRIAGIFSIGLEEYDTAYIFCSLNFFNELFDTEGAETVALKTKTVHSLFSLNSPADNDEKLMRSIKKQFPNFSVHSWQDMYPALVSSLKLEKYAFFLIIALITLVASMNMISLLFINIQQKQRDIAILQAMGMHHKNLSSLFIAMGMIVTIISTIAGCAIAAVAGYILEKYPFIELPDVYYVSQLPARVEPHLFIIVFLASICIGFLATWIPAQRTRTMSVISILRST